MSDKKPEALRLAEMNEATNDDSAASVRLLLRAKSAAELRRQHAELIAKDAAIAELVDVLRGLDDAYCRAGSTLNRDERNEDRRRLIAARAAIAKHGAAS